MRVLVTGGCGFIGSHQAVSLIEAGHDVLIVDNLSNSYAEQSLAGIKLITGERPSFVELDVRDTDALSDSMREHKSEAVIHFAASKHVWESIDRPLHYYQNNVGGLLSLLRACEQTNTRNIVFSSSGSVYGDADSCPIPESAPHRPTNPYSSSKSIGEQILSDYCDANEDVSVVALRYFNPAGAHPSGHLGEISTSRAANLLPVLVEVADGRRNEVVVYGDDYDTIDGTGVRDYVHVCDVANRHLDSIELAGRTSGFVPINIGRGEGQSVLELIEAFEGATGTIVPYSIRERRQGDVPSLYADPSLSVKLLGNYEYRPIREICADAWNYTSSTAG